jgi:predicted methyltransferase
MGRVFAQIEIELSIERGRPGDQHELVGAGLGPDTVLRGLANLAADEAVGGQTTMLDQPPDRELDVLLGRAVGNETIDDLAHRHAGVRVSFDDGEHGVLQWVGHGAPSMDRGGDPDKVCAANEIRRTIVAMRARFSLLALALVIGCAGTPAAPIEPEVGAAPSESEAPLVSVRPNVNDPYMEAGAVETWTAKLEGERREVIAEREAIVAALELAPGMIVADVGAGTGAFLQALSGELGPEGKLFAVDIVPQFLDHLRARAAAETLSNVEVIAGSDTATNLPGASVDLLFLCDTYHHLEYPSVYLRSLHQTLRPDGRLIIIDFEKIPGKTSPAMMKHVRQDKATLLAEVTAEGFELEREIDSVALDENYMLVFRKAAPPPAVAVAPPPAQVLEVDPINYKLVLAGDIVIGLGGAGLVTMLAGLGVRFDAVNQREALSVATEPDLAAITRQDRRIATGTILAITGGAAAAVLFATGITLVAVGHARERKRREALQGVVAPLFGPTFVGLSWQGRF